MCDFQLIVRVRCPECCTAVSVLLYFARAPYGCCSPEPRGGHAASTHPRPTHGTQRTRSLLPERTAQSECLVGEVRKRYISIWSASVVRVQGVVLLTVGWSYVGNDVTHSTLLDRACACSYENLPKYRSYRVSNTAPWTEILVHVELWFFTPSMLGVRPSWDFRKLVPSPNIEVANNHHSACLRSGCRAQFLVIVVFVSSK